MGLLVDSIVVGCGFATLIISPLTFSLASTVILLCVMYVAVLMLCFEKLYPTVMAWEGCGGGGKTYAFFTMY